MTKLRNVHFHRHSLTNVSIDFVIVFVIIIRFLFSYRLVFVSDKNEADENYDDNYLSTE